MRIFDDSLPPRKPTITSQASANAQFAAWLKENNFNTITDGDGLAWHLHLSSEVSPDTLQKVQFEIQITLSTEIGAAELMQCNAVDPDHDRRLLEFLGTHRLPAALTPWKFNAPTEEDAKGRLVQLLPEIRTVFNAKKLRVFKRSLLHKWLDQLCSFGDHSQ